MTQVKMGGFPGGGHRMVSMHEAVEGSIIDPSFEDRSHDDIKQWVGRIVECLHAKGIMEEADIQDLLSPRYKFL